MRCGGFQAEKNAVLGAQYGGANAQLRGAGCAILRFKRGRDKERHLTSLPDRIREVSRPSIEVGTNANKGLASRGVRYEFRSRGGRRGAAP